jgi:2-keto-4-pentenoate hydratase
MTTDTYPKAFEAAHHIWSHWQAGAVMERLPNDCRPRTALEGYAVQSNLPLVSGRSVLGWKIAATSAVGQSHIQVSGPLAGRLLSGQVFEDGFGVSLKGNRMRVVEPEFAFMMGNDLPPRDIAYSQKEVLSAIESLHPALEIPDSRFVAFAQAGEAQLLADNACAGHFVLGPAAPNNWREAELSKHPVKGSITRVGGKNWSRLGSGAAVLGDPLIAMTWLANCLSALGHVLEAGHIVTTGTCMAPLEVNFGDAVVAQYGKFGCVRVLLLE